VITDVWDRQLQIDEATATVIDLCEASTAAQPPADGALNTNAAMFHSAEERELIRKAYAAPNPAAQEDAAPQEELREDASYESMNLAAMVLSDCGHSSNYTPLLERVAGRIDRHVERLLTAQRADLTRRAQAEPAAPASQDAEDALVAALIECDRQTESMRIWDGMGYRYHPPQARQIHDTARAAIDAARGAQGESNG
jgi:hypothetical protein